MDAYPLVLPHIHIYIHTYYVHWFLTSKFNRDAVARTRSTSIREIETRTTCFTLHLIERDHGFIQFFDGPTERGHIEKGKGGMEGVRQVRCACVHVDGLRRCDEGSTYLTQMSPME